MSDPKIEYRFPKAVKELLEEGNVKMDNETAFYISLLNIISEDGRYYETHVSTWPDHVKKFYRQILINKLKELDDDYSNRRHTWEKCMEGHSK